MTVLRPLYRCALVLCLTVLPTPAPAAEEGAGALVAVQRVGSDTAVLSAGLDRDSVGLGGRLRLRVSLQAPRGATVRFSELAPGLSNLRVVDTEAIGPVLLSERRQEWLRDVTLEADRAGTARVQGLTAHVLDAAAGAQAAERLRLPPLELKVTTVLPQEVDLSKPRALAPPLSLAAPAAVRPGLLALVMAAVVLLLLAGAVLWRRRQPAAPADATPADRAALAALAGLRVAPGMTEREVERFYASVAEILRGYIARGFGLDAPRRTTQEVLAAVHGADHRMAGARPLLEPLLVDCDMVKFARNRPDQQAMQQVLGRAGDFVQRSAQGQLVAEGGKPA